MLYLKCVYNHNILIKIQRVLLTCIDYNTNIIFKVQNSNNKEIYAWLSNKKFSEEKLTTKIYMPNAAKQLIMPPWKAMMMKFKTRANGKF